MEFHAPYYRNSLLLIFLPFAFWSRKHRAVLVAISSVTIFALLLGLSNMAPALSFFHKIPLANAFRLHLRTMSLGYFLIVVLVGIGISTFWEKAPCNFWDPKGKKPNWFWALVIVILAGFIIESLTELTRFSLRLSVYIYLLAPYLLIGLALLLDFSKFSDRMKRLGKGFLLISALIVALIANYRTSAVSYLTLPACIVSFYMLLQVIFNRDRQTGKTIAAMTTLILLIPATKAGALFGYDHNLTIQIMIFSCGALIFFRNWLIYPSWVKKLGIWTLAVIALAQTGSGMYLRESVPATADATDVFFDQRVRWAKENADQERVLLLPEESVGNWNIGTMFRIFSINSYDSLTLARWRNYIRFFVGPGPFDRLTFWRFYGIIDNSELAEIIVRRAPIAELCSIRYFISHHEYDEERFGDAWELHYESDGPESKMYVYENKAALPRAYLVDSYLTTSNEEESLRAIRENISQLSHSVILENGVPSFPSRAEPRNSPGQVRIAKYGINEVELEVNAKEPSLVVLTDGYYPGWNAFVDGEKRPVWRANSLFRAVETPQGAHKLVFRFQPASLRWGAAISCFTLLLILIALFLDRRYLVAKLTRAN
jgi:hypothetical protein